MIQSLHSNPYLPIVYSFLSVLMLTPMMRSVASKTGFIDSPTSDRWHTRPVALLGGIAIVFGVGWVCWWSGPADAGFRMILAATAFLAAVGLVDDARPLKPYQKLAAQFAAAAAMIYAGYSLPWTGSPVFNIIITVVWLVGITNAVNLLDNMDGLAAGVAAIAASFLGLNFAINGQETEAVMLFALAAGLAAFLVYNFHPASIFMGDCGSMSVGFFLASAALLAVSGGRSRSLLSVLAVPVLILLIPIFDTLLVTILRTLAGKSIAQGWNDHLSHRLVALGLSERKAVLLLYGLAFASGVASFLVGELSFDVALAILASLLIALTLLGIRLTEVRIFSEAELQAARKRPLVSLLFELSFKRRIFEMALDVVLFVLSYYLACAFTGGNDEGNPAWKSFRQVLAILVTMRLSVFLGLGVYRGIWKYISLDDITRYAKAVVFSSILTAFLARFVQPLPVQGSVLVLEGLIAFLLITGSRVAFLVCGRMLPATSGGHATRVLIFGAGDSGTMMLRMMESDPKRTYEPVGFLDDDPLKEGMRIYGRTVFRPDANLRSVVEDLRVKQLIVASEKISDVRVFALMGQLTEQDMEAYRLSVELKKFVREPMMAAG